MGIKGLVYLLPRNINSFKKSIAHIIIVGAYRPFTSGLVEAGPRPTLGFPSKTLDSQNREVLSDRLILYYYVFYLEKDRTEFVKLSKGESAIQTNYHFLVKFIKSTVKDLGRKRYDCIKFFLTLISTLSWSVK